MRSSNRKRSAFDINAEPAVAGCWICVLLLVLIFGSASKADYDPDASKTEAKSFEVTWHDEHRNRDLPARIYYPGTVNGKRPVIIFSHGLGGSRDGYGYLGEYWASHGYVSVHLTHHGSDTAAIAAGGLVNVQETARAIVADPMQAVDRCRDVSFAINRLTDANDDDKSPLKGQLNLDQIGMAGHSFGGNTTMLIAGELTLSGKSFADDRVKCAIAMSPPVPIPPARQDKAYSEVQIPLFVMTGTNDDSPIGDTRAAERRAPFDHVQKIPAYLITFNGGDHMVFSGRKRDRPTDKHFQELILQGSLAFWDAHLRGDASAKNWLDTGGYEKAVGADGKFELRNVRKD